MRSNPLRLIFIALYSCLESNTSDKLEPELSPNNSIFEQKAEIRNL